MGNVDREGSFLSRKVTNLVPFAALAKRLLSPWKRPTACRWETLQRPTQFSLASSQKDLWNLERQHMAGDGR